MPFLIPFIPAIATVGAAVIGASAAGHAQDKALSAQNTATSQSLAAQQAALDRITGLQQPFIQAGTSALPGIAARVNAGAPNFSSPSYANPQPGGTPAPNAGLMDRATGVPAGSLGTGKTGNGVSVDPASAGPSTAPPPSAPVATGPDWDAYIAKYPDIQSYIANLQQQGTIGNGPGAVYQTPEQFAAEQYKETGQSEGRDLPQTSPTPPQAQTPAQPVDLGTASPVVANYTRPDQPNAPTFGPSPNASQFIDPSKFTTSPGYQFRLDQGLRNTNASFGAKGLLQSGAALQGFNDYAQNSASAEYQNWFNQQQQLYADTANQYNADRSSGLNQFNLDRNNLNNNYTDDRSYGTNLAISNRDFANNQYNTQTQNMFQLAGVGANAANAISGAVTNNANNSTNLFTAQGNNAANGALANGQTQAQLGGTIGSTVANLFSGTPRASTLIPGSNLAPNGGNANFVNPLPTYSYGGGF